MLTFKWIKRKRILYKIPIREEHLNCWYRILRLTRCWNLLLLTRDIAIFATPYSQIFKFLATLRKEGRSSKMIIFRKLEDMLWFFHVQSNYMELKPFAFYVKTMHWSYQAYRTSMGNFLALSHKILAARIQSPLGLFLSPQ